MENRSFDGSPIMGYLALVMENQRLYRKSETGAETVDNFVCIVFKGLILLTKLFISYNKGNVFLL
jgi:hypothetical protein